MYLKKTPNTHGRIRLSIVDNYYDKVKKCSRQKTVESIGWLDELENSMMTRLPILQNVWRSSMKKNRKNRLQSTLLFMIQTDFVSVITCEKTSAMLH